MNIIRQYLLERNIPDIEVGDEILVGKFKNRLAIVKGFETDDRGQRVIVTDKGKVKAFKFRIKKDLVNKK